MVTVTVDALADGLTFPVGARWHAGHLWFSDTFAGEVLALDPISGTLNTVAEVAGLPAGLGFLPDGRLLIASMRDRLLLRREPDGSIVVHADVAGVTHRQLADLCVDAEGRAYVGSSGETGGTTSDLAMAEPDGTVHDVAGGLAGAGGCVVSTGGETLTVAESRSIPAQLTAFTVEPDGGLEQQRVFAEFPDPVRPEGLVTDAEDGIWVASPTTAEVVRVDADGAVTDRLTVRWPHSIALGGEDGRDLFVCTARHHVPEVAAEQRSGAVLRFRVDVPAPGV